MGLLLFPAIASADSIDPTATWLGPWSPTLNSLTTSSGLGADASAFRSFGDLGEAGSLPDTSASAFSRATAGSATFGDASATTGVAFNRSFQLSGSPAGWDVTLSGRLVGLLFSVSPTAPAATVTAGAQIVAGDPVLNWAITETPDTQQSVNQPMVGTAVLADGTYAVVGFLTTSASVDATFNPPATGNAKADFASQDADGFFVGVDATPRPVPEPSTWIMLSTGLTSLCRICFLWKSEPHN